MIVNLKEKRWNSVTLKGWHYLKATNLETVKTKEKHWETANLKETKTVIAKDFCLMKDSNSEIGRVKQMMNLPMD